jgi:hypothetical protein
VSALAIFRRRPKFKMIVLSSAFRMTVRSFLCFGIAGITTGDIAAAASAI